MRDLIHVSDEVRTALEEERAVVALETTLVAHGFPAPDGVETGLASEAAVRAAGARPGHDRRPRRPHPDRPRAEELERFTPEARKLGPRDLAACAVQGAVGATTVGGTLDGGRRGRDPVHGHRRPRRRPPRLSDTTRRLGRPRRRRPHPGRRRLLGRQVDPRRARDRRAARDARHPGDRLPHRHAAALLRRRRRPARLRPRRRRRPRSPGSQTRTGGSAATRSSSAARRPRASTSRR